MPSNQRYWTWPRFVAAITPVLEESIRTKRRVPTSRELRARGFSWASNAAYKYYGGYRAVLTKLGYPIPVTTPDRRKYSWADWGRFAGVAGPILVQLRQTLMHTSTTTELRAHRHNWIVQASSRYHTGYHAVLTRLGLPLPPRPLRLRRASITPRWDTRDRSGRVRRGYWTIRAHQVAVLRKHFADDIAVGRFPASGRVSAIAAGLANHWLRQPGGWKKAAASYTLLPLTIWERQDSWIKLIDEALTFFERHGRYPKRCEASASLRYRVWHQRRGWHGLFATESFHPRLLAVLIERWEQHAAWANSKHLARRVAANERLIAHRTSLTTQEPFGRPAL